MPKSGTEKNTIMTAANKPPKPGKPSPDFPLFAHHNGQWAKKIQGRLRYFGPWEDANAALQRYEKEFCTQVSLNATADDTPTTPNTPQTRRGANRRGPKPKKPYPTFPLTPLTNGQWGKRIRGEIRCFGPWRDPDTALKRFQAEKDDLYAGRTPTRTDGLTIRVLLNEFLKSKQDLVASDELEQATLDEYTRVTDFIADQFRRETLIEKLTPQHFRRLRSVMAERLGPVALTNWIQRVRSVFRYATEEQLIAQPVVFGSTFKKPKPKIMRKAKNDQGPRMFTPWEVQKMIREANPDLKAMILLGINCGFGCTDCAKLPKQIVDLKTGWLRYPRNKTQVIRRCPLWAETVDALKTSLAQRPAPATPEDDEWFFLLPNGRSYHAGKQNHWTISTATVRLMKRLEIHRARLGFYTLRHVFQTIGDGARDTLAVKAIMGHAARSDDMAAFYREDVEQEEQYGMEVKKRLTEVTDHVHTWVFQSEKPDKQESQATVEASV